MPTGKKLTGYPSVDKPWLKYYTEEAINAKMPECTIYEYLWQSNKDHLEDTALRYFDRKISFGELFDNIEKVAKAFSAAGIKQGDIVVVSKKSFKDGEPIIKRIIATENQEVDIDFVAGIVYVDGVALDEPYTLTPTNNPEGTSFPLVVEEGCIFVMGDKVNASIIIGGALILVGVRQVTKPPKEVKENV